MSYHKEILEATLFWRACISSEYRHRMDETVGCSEGPRWYRAWEAEYPGTTPLTW